MPEAFTNFWFLLFGMITIIVVVGTLSTAWNSTYRTRAELDFKMQLVQRGMSVEDIERIIVASSDPEGRTTPVGPSGVDETSLDELVAVLAGNSASPTLIEQVLTAFRSVDAPTQRLISRAVQSLLENAEDEVSIEQILAVVRPLCQPREQPETVPLVRDGAFRA